MPIIKFPPPPKLDVPLPSILWGFSLLTVVNATHPCEVAKKPGCNHSGGGYVVLRAAARQLDLPTDQMIEYGLNAGPGYNHIKFIPLSEILVENSNYTNIARLKIRLLREELLEAKCNGEGCGIIEWRGKPISLQLDHINGVNLDHRIENLRLLCPNCHSQTATFAGKNKRN